jgi:hypothetical protein
MVIFYPCNHFEKFPTLDYTIDIVTKANIGHGHMMNGIHSHGFQSAIL